MRERKSNLTLEEFLDFDIEPYFAAKTLRHDRPWTYDIIRVLWGRLKGAPLTNLYRELWAMRNPAGLPMPKAFEETIRRSIYDHTSEASGWDGKAEDDLFSSPRRGVWAVRRAAAAAWLRGHNLPEA